MFGEFVWWQGVVEDRIDPLKLGRCRVRILGYHTDNKQEGVGIPTEHLPWATPSQPITSAAMNGIGTTPMGPVEGTWVFGFFRDGKNAQEPVMMSTFGGIPQKESVPSKGFNDPKGKYPLKTHIGTKNNDGTWTGEPDVNRLARGGGAKVVPLKGTLQIKSSEDSPSLDYKRKSRTKSVPIADAGNIRTTSPNTNNINLYPPGSEITGGGDTGVINADISDTTHGGTAESATEFHRWNEPNPRYGGVKDSDVTYLDSIKVTSLYPHNHVRMSECGHVEEWDDSPTSERLHKFHKSGTFEEIQPDGTKITKIVNDEYEITLGKKNVSITGTCNVTITGDCRMLYQGDLVQEVKGDYHLNVHGDKRTKISGNEITEVLADRKVVVNGNCDLKVGKDQIINIDKDRTINVIGDVKENITGNLDEITQGTMFTGVGENTTLVSVKALDITSLGDMGISTNSNFNHTVTGNSTHKISGNASIDVLGSFRHKITGITYKQYMSAFHERWDGDKWTHTNANTFSRHNSGTDHSCPADPPRSGATSCAPVEPSGL